MFLYDLFVCQRDPKSPTLRLEIALNVLVVTRPAGLHFYWAALVGRKDAMPLNPCSRTETSARAILCPLSSITVPRTAIAAVGTSENAHRLLTPYCKWVKGLTDNSEPIGIVGSLFDRWKCRIAVQSGKDLAYGSLRFRRMMILL